MANVRNETYAIANVRWVAKNYWASACTYTFKSDGAVDGKRQVYTGSGTNVLVRLNGSWRIVHEHLSR